jgi:hypothetical protein
MHEKRKNMLEESFIEGCCGGNLRRGVESMDAELRFLQSSKMVGIDEDPGH